MPKSVSFGNRTLSLSSNFELRTYRSNYLDSSGILNEAFERMMHLVKAGHMLKTDFPDSGIQDSVDIALNTFDDMLTSLPVLAGINIAIRSPNETLNFGIDESYYLYVPDTGSILFARVEAATVFGALHALETFSQLCNFNFTTKALELHSAPLTIYDQPRLNDNNMTLSDGYRYFVLRAQNIAISHGYDIINWEETFNNFGDKLSPKTVVHNWLGQGVAQKVVAEGLRCIVSNQDRWYLDHLDVPWQHFYANEPLTNITDPNQRKLVLGGEVCMWGEQIDTSNIQRTIWPRAAAAAERLWTPLAKLPKNPREVALRLAHFRCLLNQRGIQAAPLDGYSQNGPQDPGSCINQ
ncbi:Beta-hexosaminidase [Rhynchospora pubera]|uniref:beta-N-acetylhexosaminidase n=1 Tax=Rhynchospora pubera TaxID=906938 RepID=A0AAV8FZR9_9POAL|nr:Beta-hexosaminidase [Rhynchospora pubera]